MGHLIAPVLASENEHPDASLSDEVFGCIPDPAKQAPQDRQLFGIDLFVAIGFENLDHLADGDLDVALVRLSNFAHCVQQGQDVVPFDVVARGVPKNLRQGVALVAVQACM
jgi:hypothetical protein